MKERPILFNGDMVRAILDGRKTQTRRPVKPQPVPFGEDSPFTQATIKQHIGKPWMPVGGVFQDAWKKPFGTVGDRLWVRETWAAVDWCDNSAPRDFGSAVWYQADDSGPHAAGAIPYKTDKRGKWRPSIHMPRWASRIDLEITRVWVERVQDMEGMNAADSDALKEGVNRIHHEGGNYYYSAFRNHPHQQNWTDPFLAFKELWQSIYGTWDANPLVWAYEFRRIKP